MQAYDIEKRIYCFQDLTLGERGVRTSLKVLKVEVKV